MSEVDRLRADLELARAKAARLDRVAAVAREMRAAQKGYFRDKTPSALARSKELEKRLDALLSPPEPGLFDGEAA